MSRIYDALRRGRASANGAAARSPRPESVLAALHERPAERSSGGRALLVVLVLVVLGATGWMAISRFREAAPSAPTGPGAAAPAIVTPPAAPPVQVQVSRAPVPDSRPAPLDPRPPVVEPRSPSSDPRSPNRDRQSDLQLALYHQRAGDFEQALMHYKVALQRDEMNVEAHNNLGGLYLGRGLSEEAVREFQRVIAIEPRYVTAHVNLSAAYYRLGRFDAAAAQAREALRLDPRNVDGLVNLALAQKGAGQAAEAQLSLRRALELNPRHPLAHYNLARQYDDGGETVRAAEHYRLFLQYAGPDQEPYAAGVRARLRTTHVRD